jgi:hypothetical protein
MNSIFSDSNKKRFTFQSLEKKVILFARLNSKNSTNSGGSIIIKKPKGDYVPYKNKELHRHNHVGKKQPHIHTKGCEQFISAHDINREKRYYFTNELTPVRVYINYTYNEEKIEIKKFSDKDRGISKKFKKEISNMVFIQDTRSFIPSIAARYLLIETQNGGHYIKGLS